MHRSTSFAQRPHPEGKLLTRNSDHYHALIVAVIGAGKIGEAVANSIAKSRQVTKVIMTKRNVSTLPRSRSGKVAATSDNREAAKKADLILIAVKAGDAKHVLSEISQFTASKIVISLMAAITIERLERALPKAKVVRSMPNIAAVIGEAITAYSLGSKVTPDDAAKVEFILGCFGDYVKVPESLLNPITALSGSGPAYIAVVIEAMVSAGLKVGIPRDVSFKLVTKTLTGTANLLSDEEDAPCGAPRRGDDSRGDDHRRNLRARKRLAEDQHDERGGGGHHGC